MDVAAIASEGMQQDLQRLQTISQNLANVLTPGYKKQIFTGTGFSASVEKGMAQAPSSASLGIDASAGTLRYTGDPHDVAINGQGYFEVASPEGPMYSRIAALHSDSGGRLVGSQGLPMSGVGGEIALNGSEFTVDVNGDVRQAERLAGRLKVVRFDNPEALAPVGNGLYRQDGARIGQGGDSTLRPGYQENSNVNSPQEMVRLTETVRHFEALQKIMQSYDDSMEQTFRKLGDF